MATSAEDVLENILAKKIDKQDALRKFNELSDEEKSRVVVNLRSRLHDEDQAKPAESDTVAPKQAPTLKSVHEAEMSDAQKDYIAQLSRTFAERAAKSKHNALSHQKHFVDQRKVAGLKRPLKSMQFQLTYDRAEGPYLYDVDGNQYVDITGDNGVNFFGHQPQFLKDALIKRLNQGYPLVAYSEDLFESARLFCEITGHERMVYAQTGTEAVMWATRIARAATGKKKVVIYDGSYHGLSDNVLAVRGRNGATLSAGLGMLQEFADQLIILDYGDPSSLEFIEKNAADIACVLTEPVQSRFPARQPVEYVQELRRITLEKDIVLIFDEMVTGFRAGRKGAEGFYKVKPDITTYGKVPGGGMPTGIIAGLAKYLDYVDGGVWGFDDNSMPSIRRAVMAGTHTQNSLKVSATLAVCREMQKICPAGNECDYVSCSCPIGDLNKKTAVMCEEINAYFIQKRVPLALEQFSSLFRLFVNDDPYGLTRELLIILLKVNGVETSTSGNNFLNLSHKDEDMRWVIDGFKKSVDAMVEHGFFFEPPQETEAAEQAAAKPAPEVKPQAATSSPAAQDAGKSQIDTLRELILADLRAINGKGH
jgi:glutamate-1-semialdehyde 2,1-aminomutase